MKHTGEDEKGRAGKGILVVMGLIVWSASCGKQEVAWVLLWDDVFPLLLYQMAQGVVPQDDEKAVFSPPLPILRIGFPKKRETGEV